MNAHLKAALIRYLREPLELCIAAQQGSLESVTKLCTGGVDINTLVRSPQLAAGRAACLHVSSCLVTPSL